MDEMDSTNIDEMDSTVEMDSTNMDEMDSTNMDEMVSHFIDDDDDLILAMQINAYIINLLQSQKKWGGSVPGRITIDRRRLEGDLQLFNDYFSDNPTYPELLFRRRFRMRPGLFQRIAKDIQINDIYFVQKRDAAGKLGFSTFQKMTSALRMMAYGCSADSVDEYTRMAESTSLECLKRFCQAIVAMYKDKYMRSPNEQDITRLLKVAKERGFPGMLGSLDCMHWTWKNCPMAYHGQYSGKEKEPTVVLEAVASYDLWIWHAFFGLPGTLNDINILDQSPIFDALQNGLGPDIEFKVNGNNYSMGYYLSDGIYPPWATLVQTISNPVGKKNKYFAKKQEAYQKDIERAFGVLQQRFAIIQNPVRLWKKDDLWTVMIAAVILHNMIIEDERDSPFENRHDYHLLNRGDDDEDPPADSTDLQEFLLRYQCIRSRTTHAMLKEDLIDHLWNKCGEERSEAEESSEDETEQSSEDEAEEDPKSEDEAEE